MTRVYGNMRVAKTRRVEHAHRGFGPLEALLDIVSGRGEGGGWGGEWGSGANLKNLFEIIKMTKWDNLI